MSVTTAQRTGPVTLVAPIAGRVRLHAPGALCGETEVFREHETIATVAGEPVPAPGHGFVLRALVADGALVQAEDPLLTYSVTG